MGAEDSLRMNFYACLIILFICKYLCDISVFMEFFLITVLNFLKEKRVK
jgi:hypothetical protein